MPSRRQRSTKFPRFRLRGWPAQGPSSTFDGYDVENASTAIGVSHASAPNASRKWAGPRLYAIPIAVSLAVLLAGIFPVAAVRDAATLQSVTDVSLGRPDAYVDFAPFSNVLDTITLLSGGQHIAILLGLMGIWAVC